MARNKIIIFISFLFSVFFLSWIILYSSFLANNSFLIPIRKNFYNFSGFSPSLYTISKKSDDSFIYSLSGKFIKFDFLNNEVHITDNSNNLWKIEYQPQYNREVLNRVKIQYNQLVKNEKSQFRYFEVDPLENPTQDIFVKNEEVKIFWNDTRTLQQIKLVQKNDETIQTKFMVLTKLN